MNDQTAKILLVDDEPNVLKALCRQLRNYDLVTASSGEEALLIAKNATFDLVISDYRMPYMDGISFLIQFAQIQPDAVRLILTGYADLEATLHAINDIGVFRFINKPWSNLEIMHAIDKGLEMKRILLENRTLANQVREQQTRLNQQEAILRALEAEEPGITKVNWGPDGAIILDEASLGEDDGDDLLTLSGP